jgi:hypothetical protein
MGRLGRKSACVAVVASLVGAAGAQANTLTLGSEFQGMMIGGFFDGGAGTVANTSLPSPLLAGAPSDGTIVSWRFSGATDPFIPQVLRPAAGGLYTEVARGPSQQGAGVGTISGPFPLAIPVKQGDLVGVIGQSFTHLGVVVHPGAGVYGYWAPPLAAGESRAPDFGGPGNEEAISATLRYCLVPSLKGKKPKQAKQALKAADCTVGTKRKSKKRRRKKKVVGQSVPAGTSISDTAPVNFKVSRRLR